MALVTFLVGFGRPVSSMLALMLTKKKDFKILRGIILPVPVLVVDLFPRVKASAKNMLHYLSVLKSSLTVSVRHYVSVTVEVGHGLMMPKFRRNAILTTTIYGLVN